MLKHNDSILELENGSENELEEHNEVDEFEELKNNLDIADLDNSEISHYVIRCVIYAGGYYIYKIKQRSILNCHICLKNLEYDEKNEDFDNYFEQYHDYMDEFNRGKLSKPSNYFTEFLVLCYKIFENYLKPNFFKKSCALTDDKVSEFFYYIAEETCFLDEINYCKHHQNHKVLKYALLSYSKILMNNLTKTIQDKISANRNKRKKIDPKEGNIQVNKFF